MAVSSAKLRLVVRDISPMKKVQELQEEARAIAMAQVAEFEEALIQISGQARELADAGDSIPAGVRELCRSFAEDSDARAKTLGVLLNRRPGASLLQDVARTSA
jgi:hypothetical protein